MRRKGELISYFKLYDISDSGSIIDVKKCKDIEVEEISIEGCLFDAAFENIIFYVN